MATGRLSLLAWGLLCVQGCYAGSPNIARCRAGVLNECKYIPMDKLVDSFPEQCKPDTILPSSIGGMTEYNSYAFGGAYSGRIFIAGYKKHVVRFDPETGKSVTYCTVLYIRQFTLTKNSPVRFKFNAILPPPKVII